MRNPIGKEHGIGIDCSRYFENSAWLSAQFISQIHDAVHEHKVAYSTGVNFNDLELKSLMTSFGPLFSSPADEFVLGSSQGLGAVVTVGNATPEHPNALLGNQEVLPHSDHQWLRCPSAYSMLYAIDVAKDAAYTEWTDMALAYNTLSDDIKEAISRLQMITYNPFHRPFGTICSSYVNRAHGQPPGKCYPHPLVRTHPITREKILYVNAAYEVEFVGIPYSQGAALLQTLVDHLSRQELKFRHYWSVGDLVIWDNRSTVHYRPEFGANVKRVLKRISIGGEAPF